MPKKTWPLQAEGKVINEGNKQDENERQLPAVCLWPNQKMKKRNLLKNTLLKTLFCHSRLLSCLVFFFLTFSTFHQHCFAENGDKEKIKELDNKIKAASNDTVLLQLKIEKMLLVWAKDSILAQGMFQEISSEILRLKIKSQQLQLLYYFAGGMSEKGHVKEFYNIHRKGLLLAKNIKKGNWKSRFYAQLARHYHHQDEIKNSVAYYDSALMLMDSPDPAFNAMLKTDQGRNHYDLGNYRNAMLHYIEAQRLYENHGIVNDSYVKIFHYIGSVFKRLENQGKAISYYQKMFEIAKKINNISLECEALDLMASSYKELGDSKKCLELRKEALQLSQQTKDFDLQVLILLNLANYHNSEKEFNQALSFINKAEAIGNKYQVLEIEDEIYIALMKGRMLSKTGNHKEAVLYLEKALTMSKGIEGKKLLTLSEVYAALAFAYSRMGNYQSAFENILVHMDYNDSLLNMENVQATLEMEKKYQAEKKEAEIRILQLDKAIQKIALEKERSQKKLLIAGLLGAILVALFLSVRYFKKRKENSLEV